MKLVLVLWFVLVLVLVTSVLGHGSPTDIKVVVTGLCLATISTSGLRLLIETTRELVRRETDIAKLAARLKEDE